MEGEGLREIPPRESAVRHLLETEVDEIDLHDPRLGAITWTSIEMLQKMIATKSLLGCSAASRNPEEVVGLVLPGLGAASIDFPRNHDVDASLSNLEYTKGIARVMAAATAERHYFLDQFGLPFDNYELNNAVAEYLEVTNPDMNEFDIDLTGTNEDVAKHEIAGSARLFPFLTPDAFERLPRVAREARERKGILIGIATPSPASEFRVAGLVAPEDHFMRFTFGQDGMPYHNIGANKPQGAIERAFYESLRKGNNPHS